MEHFQLQQMFSGKIWALTQLVGIRPGTMEEVPAPQQGHAWELQNSLSPSSYAEFDPLNPPLSVLMVSPALHPSPSWSATVGKCLKEREEAQRISFWVPTSHSTGSQLCLLLLLLVSTVFGEEIGRVKTMWLIFASTLLTLGPDE